MNTSILRRLVHRYLELEARAQAPAVSRPHLAGRGAGSRTPAPGPSEALLRKLDLDRALEEVYRRFFGPD